MLTTWTLHSSRGSAVVWGRGRLLFVDLIGQGRAEQELESLLTAGSWWRKGWERGHRSKLLETCQVRLGVTRTTVNPFVSEDNK